MSALALTVARNMLSAINRHDPEALAAQFTPGGVQTEITGEQTAGRQAIQEHYTSLFTAFPDVQFQLRQRLVTSANSVTIEGTLEGTHLGPLTLMGTTLAPTGRTVRVPMLFSTTLNNDGQITSATATADSYQVLLQLGVAPLRTTEDQRIGTVRKLTKAAIARDIEAIMACYAPLARFDTGTDTLDRDEIRAAWTLRLKAFPNGVKITEKEIGVDGPAVLVRATLEGVFTQDGMPGKEVTLEMVDIFEVGAFGIFNHRSYVDNTVLYKAMGLIQ